MKLNINEEKDVVHLEINDLYKAFFVKDWFISYFLGNTIKMYYGYLSLPPPLPTQTPHEFYVGQNILTFMYCTVYFSTILIAFWKLKRFQKRKLK